MPAKRVLVVGTTSDYVDIIAHRHPGRALFLTDAREREAAWEVPPARGCELLADLTQFPETTAKIEEYTDDHKIRISGVACFDDESMSLASYIAAAFDLPYPSAAAVANSRDKYRSKQMWQKTGITCPRSSLVDNSDEAVEFMNSINGPVVVKPLTGSGSELTRACFTEADCRSAVEDIAARIKNHSNRRMFGTVGESGKLDSRRVIVIEEFVRGDEYSADFIVDGDKTRVIRVASKSFSLKNSFGTALSYTVPAELPSCMTGAEFPEMLGSAALALGIRRSICMVDIIVRDDKVFLLEMAPRPGGDCLPFLISRSSGFNIWGAALDLAEGNYITIPEPSAWRQLIGARIIATENGLISDIDISAALEDSRVRECYLKRFPGHIVVLPPDDYDSRILGHIIFEPEENNSRKNQTSELLDKVIIKQGKKSCTTKPNY